MLQSICYLIISLLSIYLFLATMYSLALAVAYFFLDKVKPSSDNHVHSFAILVPAHNEELLVGNLCQSLLHVDYPKDRYEIFVIADNCTDSTAAICRNYNVHVLERNDPEQGGKGQALAWGLRQVGLRNFDAVFMVDADNYVNPAILWELNRMLNGRERAIQCYNAVGNRDDSWFTQLLFVSRTIGNELYHEAKYRLGLSSYLMGNGLCFKSELLQRKGWTAFSTGEDWEYYAQLVEENVKIAFSANAKVYHQESRSLNQATSQRLRWARGRFRIAKTLGIRLLLKGIKERNWLKIDASFPLIFPNYSLQINLSFAVLIFSLFMPPSVAKDIFILVAIGLIAGQFLLFLAGALIAGSPGKIFIAVLYAPAFLAWKSVIDLLCLTGLYRGNKWVRTRRHRSLFSNK